MCKQNPARRRFGKGRNFGVTYVPQGTILQQFEAKSTLSKQTKSRSRLASFHDFFYF